MKFQLKNFLIEPYRLFFALGSLYAVLAVGGWFAYLHALDHDTPLFSFTEGPAFVHAHMMIYGVIGCYVFGFILTAFPRFVDQPLPGPKVIVTLAAALLASQLFLILGSVADLKWMAVAGVFEAGSYFFLGAYLTRLYLRSRNFGDKKQPVFVLMAIFFGFIGVVMAYLYYAARLPLLFYSLSVELGTYAFLLFLVVAITYRIVPFFTGKVVPGFVPRRGPYTLEIALALIVLRLILGQVFAESLLGNYLSWSLNLLLLVVLAMEWRRWIPKNIGQTPILFVLYLGLFWILVFLGFSAYEILAHLADREAAVFPLLRTPALHALYIGCFGTLLLGISTRVVRGHGGLPIVADRWMLAAILAIQIAALIRVVLPILESRWPALAGRNYWAGIFWCFAFGIWCFRYLPILGRPKVDGESLNSGR
jgi:uncharacterized protein involved in response to NO